MVSSAHESLVSAIILLLLWRREFWCYWFGRRAKERRHQYTCWCSGIATFTAQPAFVRILHVSVKSTCVSCLVHKPFICDTKSQYSSSVARMLHTSFKLAQILASHSHTEPCPGKCSPDVDQTFVLSAEALHLNLCSKTAYLLSTAWARQSPGVFLFPRLPLQLSFFFLFVQGCCYRQVKGALAVGELLNYGTLESRGGEFILGHGETEVSYRSILEISES